MDAIAKKYISTTEASEILGVSIRSVQAYAQSGKLTAQKGAKGRNHYLTMEVLGLKEERARSTHAPSDAAPQLREEAAPQLREEAAPAVAIDPSKQVVIDIEKYEELLREVARLGAECSMLRENVFDPQVHLVVDKGHYEGLLLRLSQVETELRMLREQAAIKLIEDQSKRPWWKPWWKPWGKA